MKRLGEILCHTLRDECVRAQGKVGAVLLEGAGRYDQPGVALQRNGRLFPGDLVEGVRGEPGTLEGF